MTVHCINYSYLHVTNTHELHHIDYFKNIFPDFFDILFSTKYKNTDESYIENTDHYIPNIIISTIIIYTFLYFYNNYYNYKKNFDYIFFFTYISVFIILSISSIELDDQKHKKIIKKYKNKLKKYKNKLKKYKNKLKKL